MVTVEEDYKIWWQWQMTILKGHLVSINWLSYIFIYWKLKWQYQVTYFEVNNKFSSIVFKMWSNEIVYSTVKNIQLFQNFLRQFYFCQLLHHIIIHNNIQLHFFFQTYSMNKFSNHIVIQPCGLIHKYYHADWFSVRTVYFKCISTTSVI